MKPIEKTSYELFQLLRSRFSPMNIGDENADLTVDPSQAKFFSFVYRERGKDVAPVSISIIDTRTLKVYYGNELVEKLNDSNSWYNLLKDLRYFAKSNLMNFDARDIHKDQMDTRDFEFVKTDDSAYTDKEVDLEESAMYGSKRKSYQTFENARVVVYHRGSVDEEKRGSRSRYIESIFIENSAGERFRFPVNYLSGARAMARHVSEGGTPYDAIGEYIVTTVNEIRDLSRFKQISRQPAMENQEASDIRDRVSEALNSMKHNITKMQKARAYHQFVQRFENQEFDNNNESEDFDTETLKEKFTRRLRNEKMDEVLPTVQRVLNKKVTDNMEKVNELKVKDLDVVKKSDEDAAEYDEYDEYDDVKEANEPEYFNDLGKNNTKESDELNEAAPTVEKFIKDPNSQLILKADPAADRMIKNANFRRGSGLLSFIMSDIATRVIGNESDALANFASQMSEDISREGETFGTKMTPEYRQDRQLALMLAKKYLDDVKRMSTDPDYASQVRKDPDDVYGKKKKRSGGVHEEFAQWVEQVSEQVPGAVSSGGVATSPAMQQAAAQKSAALKPDQQKIKAMSGGDVRKQQELKRVGDKLARGQKLNPNEVDTASEIAKQSLMQDKYAVDEDEVDDQDKYLHNKKEDMFYEQNMNLKKAIELAKKSHKEGDFIGLWSRDNDIIPSHMKHRNKMEKDGWTLIGSIINDGSVNMKRGFNEEFEFNGKTYKTKMDKSTAHKISESVDDNEIIRLFRKINR